MLCEFASRDGCLSKYSIHYLAFLGTSPKSPDPRQCTATAFLVHRGLLTSTFLSFHLQKLTRSRSRYMDEFSLACSA